MAFFVVCVKEGTSYSANYVNILHDMVRRNLSQKVVGKFICFTDNADELNEGISTRPLPVEGIQGWWNKISLFKPGVFERGDRVLFLDLDTLIIGSIDELANYDGPLATLEDFYRKGRVGSGVMAWTVSEKTEAIWSRWDDEKFPAHEGADQGWIEGTAGEISFLQKLFPGRIASYKLNCLSATPKRGISVVCFHGRPRPHECKADWVKGVWKIGGWTSAEIETYCNSSDYQLSINIRHSSALDIPWIEEKTPHEGHAVIVGGGPSLLYSVEEIRMRKDRFQKIFALNGAAKFLAEREIWPDYQVIMDARPENSKFVSPLVAEKFLFASQVHSSVIAGAPFGSVLLWHCNIPGIRNDIAPVKKQPVLIGGGTTVLTRAMSLAYVMGYRKIHLYGVDSSFEKERHAYKQFGDKTGKTIEAICASRVFKTLPWMVAQVNEFQIIADALAQQDCLITVHGDGLLPHVARQMLKAAA